MNAPLEPVQDGGPGARRAAAAVVAAALIVAGAALAGGGFPIVAQAPRPPPTVQTGASSLPAATRTLFAYSPPTPACPAVPTPPTGIQVTQPGPGSTRSTEGALPIAGTGAPQTGQLIADLDDYTGTFIQRIAADGSFAADMLVFPAAGPTRATLKLSWVPPGAPDPCVRTVATVDFRLEPIVPISVWLLGGPPRHIPGPPYSVTVAALPRVDTVSATLEPKSRPPIAATVYPGEIIAKRARPFSLLFPESLPRGPATLDVRWTGARPGALRLPVVVVEPEREFP